MTWTDWFLVVAAAFVFAGGAWRFVLGNPWWILNAVLLVMDVWAFMAVRLRRFDEQQRRGR